MPDDLRRDPGRDAEVRAERAVAGVHDRVARLEERDARAVRARVGDRDLAPDGRPLARHAGDTKGLELTPVVWIGRVVGTEPDPEQDRLEAAAPVPCVAAETRVGVEGRAEPVGVRAAGRHDPRQLEELEPGLELGAPREREVRGLHRERAGADVVRRRRAAGSELAVLERGDPGVGRGVDRGGGVARPAVDARARRVGRGRVRRAGVERLAGDAGGLVAARREEEGGAEPRDEDAPVHVAARVPSAQGTGWTRMGVVYAQAFKSAVPPPSEPWKLHPQP